MILSRRQIALSAAASATGLAGAAAAAQPAPAPPSAPQSPTANVPAYGLISQVIAAPGKRDELIRILAEGTAQMPGCISFVIAKDAASSDAIWITELWVSQASHNAAFNLPKVAEALAKGRPLILNIGVHVETAPVSGTGFDLR